ncbi:lipase/acyltransferase domain-containing protein [Baekduia sp. Peel2402]|uniref:lipase/acyltransferase domain-containing protein n=1 Tax=Baekduia sp. Peel2402 TaxID=3458296 RepID=UPI00403ED7DB
MLPARSLLSAAAAALALVAAAPSAHAAWPGTPGKVAFLDQMNKEYPLKVYTPGMDGQGKEDLIVPETFHFQEGTDKTPMTTGFPSAPVWSPDGTRLAFAAKVPDPSLAPGATHTAIFTWTLKNGAITQLTTPPAGKPGCSCEQQLGFGYADYSPAWSPDGKTIAFVRMQFSGEDESIHGHDGGNIRTVPATGGASTELTHEYGEQMYFSLSWGGDPDPDGGYTALLGLHGGEATGEFQLRKINPQTGVAQSQLGGAEAAQVADFDVTPDGLHFYYQRYGGKVFARQLDTLGEITPVGDGVGARMRASTTGNGPLYSGQARVPGSDMPRGGLVEYQEPDAGGDVWPEDEKQRFVNGWLGSKGSFGYAYTTVGRSLFDVQPQRLPIINIPGFGGSEIRCDGETLWGPSPLFMSSKMKNMELSSDGKTNAHCAGAGPTENPDDPTGFVMSVLGSDIYAGQAKFITGIAPGSRGWRFSWDWRKAPVESLARLDALVEKAIHHPDNEAQGITRVVMYGHSYGGLLMREYQDQHPEKLARVLTLGTPFWGATKPLNFATFGLENPLSGIADLDTLMPNAAAKAMAKNLTGLYWLVPSDPYGPWLKVGGKSQSQAGVRSFFTGTAGSNGALIDAAMAWHKKYDGFTTTRGNVEVRAVVGTGLPTIESIDVSDITSPDGELQVSLHLGQGDVTVPIRSASQGPLGTHDPLGENVHVQAICGVGHMALGASEKINDKYERYLLTGRTPRLTEGACEMEATAIVVKNLQTHPKRGAASAVASDGALSLDAAAEAGKIQLLRYPGMPIAIADDHKPVKLAVGEGVELQVMRWKGDTQLPTQTFRPGSGAVDIATGGASGPVVTAGGAVVAPVEGETTTPPSVDDDHSAPPADGGGSVTPPAPSTPAPSVPASPVSPAKPSAPVKGTATKPKPATKTTKKVCRTVKKRVKGKVKKVKTCKTVTVKKPKAKGKGKA